MTKEEILKEIDERIAFTKDWLEKAKAKCDAEIRLLEWVKEKLEK